MIDTETCDAWLRDQLRRARAHCLMRILGAVAAALPVFLMNFILLWLALIYFTALSNVSALNMPANDPVNQMLGFIGSLKLSINAWTVLLLGVFISGYIAIRGCPRHVTPQLMRCEDDNQPVMTVPNTSRPYVRVDLNRALPGIEDYISAVLFALPRLALSLLIELKRMHRLLTMRTGPCAAVVAQLYGKDFVQLADLETALGNETLAQALPQLWEFPVVAFHPGEKDSLSLGPVASDRLLVFGVN